MRRGSAAAAGCRSGPNRASVAHLTFGTRLRLDSKPNVRYKSYIRIIELLVFLMVLTFAQEFAAQASKCQIRNTVTLFLR